MTRLAQAAVSMVALGLGGGGAWYLVTTRALPAPRTPATSDPIVRVSTVRAEPLRLSVKTFGTAGPAVETVLASQVAGRIEWISDRLVVGGFVGEGEDLVRLERADLEGALAEAESRVAQAERRLTQEEAEAAAAAAEWKNARPQEPAPDLAARKPQLAEARAALAAAQASRLRARLDLERSVLKAPIAGRVRRRLVGPGQILAPGVPVAELYGTDEAEVEAPVALEDLAFLEEGGKGAEAILRADIAGRRVEWRGRVVRTGAAVDAKTRMLPLIVSVADPFGLRTPAEAGPALMPGLFLEVEILGRRIDKAVVIPRHAVRGAGEVLVVDAEDRLRPRKVSILRRENGRAIVASGLADGERVCLSELEVVADGLKVRPVAEARP